MDTKLNRSDYLILIVSYTVIVILNCIEYYTQGENLIEYLIDIPVSVITSLSAILLFIYWLIPKYFIKEKNIFLFIVLGLAILAFFGAIDYFAGFFSGGRTWKDIPKWDKLILESIFRTANYAGFIFGILLTKKFYENQSKYYKINQQQKENELKLLRSQIDPHFLFNNLNTLDALIDQDAIKAKEYINRLSLIYRYLIQTKDAEVMELASELEFAEHYIFLIKTRFGNDYDFQIQQETTLKDKFLPTGAIQILLENVVKHNKAQHGKTVAATLTIHDDNLIVSNTKQIPNNRPESLGTGLENLKGRYSLLSDKKVHIQDTTTMFTVTIPLIALSE